MRILLVSSCLPNPAARHAGGKLVAYLLERLGRHEVTVVARHYPGEEPVVEELRARWPRLTVVCAPEIYREGEPASLVRVARSIYGLTRAAVAIADRESFDVCQLEFTETGVWWPRRHARSSVLSSHDLLCKPALRRIEIARGGRRVQAWLIARLKRFAEARTLSKFGGVFVLSENDRSWANRVYPGLTPEVLSYPGGIGFTVRERAELPGRVAFLGALQRSANASGLRYFVHEVWPRVLAQAPAAEFVVAGVGPAPDLIAELAAAPRVRYLGEIDDLGEFYASASIFAAPILIGGGIIVKVLDALAAGVPVVTTSRGNEGIGALPGRDLHVADGAGAMADAILSLLDDAARRSAVGESGARFVGAHFSPDRFDATIETMYARVAAGARRVS